MKSITKKELRNIMEDTSLDGKADYCWGYEEVDNTPYKHDESQVLFVFKSQGLWYQGVYYHSYNWGIRDEDIDLWRVEPVEVKTIEWRQVK